jgi:integrase
MASKKAPAKVRGIYEREPGSGIWWIRYEVEGKPRREKVGRRSDAIALYQKRKADLRIGLKLPDNLRQRAVSVGELGRDAIQWYKDHSKRDLYTFSNRMELIIRELGGRSADSLKPKEIEDWLARHTEWSPATKNRYKTVLSKAFQLALKSDRVTRNPARLVERRNEGDGRIRYLRADEEKRLKVAIKRRCPGHLPALVFALHTGLRKAEQFNLEWKDIDFDRRVIIVPHPKNDRSREVTMSDTCHRVLKDLFKGRPNDGRVFLSDRYKKQPISNVRKAFDSALIEAKIGDFTWHCLRHTFITRLVQACVDLRTVQYLAGHQSLAMTGRYAHFAPGLNEAAVKRLDKPVKR